MTVGNGDDEVSVVCVGGTPYEMGQAMGALLKDDATAVMKTFLAMARIEDPDMFSDETLDAAFKAIEPYTDERFIEELKGIAEGVGLPYDLVRRTHMIPVVAPYACSGLAAWGKATRDEHLYQVRNLDYEIRGGLQDHPAVVIYVPNEGVPHVNVTFAGCAGVNTGMNVQGIALTEMGDSPSREYPYDLDGVHFTTLFREILYDAKSLDDAVQMIKDAKRTKKYHYIIGDGQHGAGVKMLAHAPDLVIWKDNDPTDEVAPNVLEGVVYNAEGRDPIGFAHLKKYYGRYTADSMVMWSKSVGSLGGNLLNVVYDATALELWVAYAHKLECAYRRPYVHIKVSDHVDPTAPPEGAVVFGK
ncbi:MAG: hypothetical protein GY851_06965 [bacterium]|nr:hypothetical protein [bacterium]